MSSPPISEGRWRQVKSLFHHAIEQAPEERKHYLDDLEQREPTLAKEVVSLLRSHEDPSTLADPMGPDAWLTLPGLDWNVGPYRVHESLGQGGMGSVYLASPTKAPEERVAIKLVRPDLLESEVLHRFRAETRILARLSHPNIASLLDSGTTDEGIPYLVMEYVDGLPIDRYCEENRLSIDERLELLAAVSSAVEHAHNHQIVHRDLKPSNILVTCNGVPKLLDFGIAKSLDPEVGEWALSATRTGWVPMTPLYASPEQLRGEVVGTSSDIYSLGALSHQILTGRLPFDDDPTPSRRLRQIYRGTTERPSRRVKDDSEPGSRPESGRELRRRLEGPIDEILLRAMCLEPTQRFASAAHLGRAFLAQRQTPRSERPSLSWPLLTFAIPSRKEAQLFMGSAESSRGEAGDSLLDSHLAATELEEIADLLRVGSLAPHPVPETRVV